MLIISIMFNDFKVIRFMVNVFGEQGVGIAQSVQRWAMGWTAQFRFPAVQIFFPLNLGPTHPPIQRLKRLHPWGKAAGA
jgi:hypothetical protein